MSEAHPLWTLPDDAVGAYYEARVLDWFGWSASDAPVNELATAYRRLSERLVVSAGEAPSGAFAGRLDLAVRALVYGWRSVVVARRLLRSRPASERVVELGSGLGPFGLVAAARGSAVLLVDVAGAILAESAGYFEAFGLPKPATRRATLEQGAAEPGWRVLPYSALEWAGTDAGRRRKIAEWMRRGPVLLVERGTREGGHFVQALRDEVDTAVAGPCPRRDSCALADRPGDWCHFTWSARPGPLTQRMADKAGRKWTVVHLSWLASGREVPAGLVRVLGVRPEGRHKRVAEVCRESGIDRWVAEKRDREVFGELDRLEPGVALEEVADGERRGDGLRLRNVASIRRMPIDGATGFGPTSSPPVDDL